MCVLLLSIIQTSATLNKEKTLLVIHESQV